MHVFSSELHARGQAFDAAVSKTLEALRNPYVAQQLGSLAGRLIETTENLVLPNVRHGIASLPASAVDSNRFVLLPHLPGETNSGLKLDTSLLTPTTNRVTQTVDRYSQAWGWDRTSVEDVTNSLVRNVMGMRSTVKAQVGDFKGRQTSWTVTDPDTRLMYRTRPVINTNAARTNLHPYRTGGTIAHEEVHGFDYEDALSQESMSKAFHARTELQAYHVGSVIRSAGGVLFGDGMTYEVETLRRQYTTPDAPFDPTPELITQLDALDVLTA